MQRTIFIFCQCLCLLLLLSHASNARPNPVPNDDLNPDLELQHYEKENNKLTAADRVRHREVRAPEDEEDQEVINELPMLQKIRRRNRDIYSIRPNIFQPYIDNWEPERETISKHRHER
ncbi:unnamed protein product [Allacma fusca]|uniref:Secreted protein n=1 Tax=Allacma fusca TaxID=39272 RepID=A0A8J2MEC6_9HEXA|nr:unnamed protein product [Allacma fusca]